MFWLVRRRLDGAGRASVRAGYEDDYDPIASEEFLSFEVQQDLTQHTDEELIEILEAYGQFEG